MSGRVCLDGNILIHAPAAQGVEDLRFAKANEILDGEDFGLAAQVVGEFIKNVPDPRKMVSPFDVDEVLNWVDRLYEFPVVLVDREIIEHAVYLKNRYKIECWDAQIVTGAHRLGATKVYSEDINYGQLYGSVRVVNPFKPN